MRRVSGRRGLPGQQLKIVCRGSHGELVGCSGEAPQLERSQPQVAFQVAEHALDPLSSTPHVHIGVDAGKGAHGIAGILANEAGDAAFPADGASGLHFAASTIGDMASVYANLAGAFGAALAKRLVRRAAIGIGLAIIAKGITGEEGVALAAAVNDRDVRGDIPVD